MSHNVQVKRRLAAGQMCRSEPGGAHLFSLPVRHPEEASEGQGGHKPDRLRLTDCYLMRASFSYLYASFRF